MPSVKTWNRFANGILRSPFYGLMGDSLVITVTGRKTGELYSLPVNYTQSGDTVTIISRRDRTWWRNLRGGADVTCRLRGRDVRGRANVIEDDEGVMTALTAFVQGLRRVPKRFRDIREAASTRVVVEVELCPLSEDKA